VVVFTFVVQLAVVRRGVDSEPNMNASRELRREKREPA
jgi:hypothetical protein